MLIYLYMYNYLVYNGTLHVQHLQCFKSKCTQDKSHTVVKKSHTVIIRHYSSCAAASHPTYPAVSLRQIADDLRRKTCGTCQRETPQDYPFEDILQCFLCQRQCK